MRVVGVVAPDVGAATGVPPLTDGVGLCVGPPLAVPGPPVGARA